MILKIPNNEFTQQIVQIHEDKELEQNRENYEGIADILYRMQFEELTIIDLVDQIKHMTIHAQFVKENLTQLERILQEEKKNDSKEIEKSLKQLRYRLQTIEDNYKYVSNLPDEELKSHLGTVKKTVKINVNDKEEDRKKALYNSKDQQVWKNKDVIEQIEEKYQFNKYVLLNMTKEEFNQMQTWEQQIAMRNFLIGSEFSSEKLLASLLEKQEKMHNDDEIEKRFIKNQKLVKGKLQPETFLPEGSVHNRYIPKDNTYRKRPVFSTSNFVNKNIIDPIFRRTHGRNSSTSSLPKIPSSLKNKINLEKDDKEFKLQKPPVKFKRTRTVVLTDTNLSSTNGDKWKKERDIRRKLFQESKNEEITSEDEKEINELDNIIKDDVQDYYKNRYNNQEEIGKSSKPIRYEDEDTRILEIP
ncbi:2073_t:CDS:2 [Cetraspora pellucida]|uniref:2073_t:CDS:1 n=1 Tax=Cetraspora pellucida TaxID=1433469 RepID=A0A9N8ZIQ9_9GLOM|nr:2073_t:CDS:2 [Cetraspora pellucida]